MKCSCGAECGIRIWCHKCEADHIAKVQEVSERLRVVSKRLDEMGERMKKTLKGEI
jgi:hypothetical protein